MVHFQAILALLLLLQQIDSKISKQSTKSDRGYILRLVRGDMATQFDSGCCFSFLRVLYKCPIEDGDGLSFIAKIFWAHLIVVSVFTGHVIGKC